MTPAKKGDAPSVVGFSLGFGGIARGTLGDFGLSLRRPVVDLLERVADGDAGDSAKRLFGFCGHRA